MNLVRKIGPVWVSLAALALVAAAIGLTLDAGAARPGDIDDGLAHLRSKPSQVNQLLGDYSPGEVAAAQVGMVASEYPSKDAMNLDLLQTLEMRRACNELRAAFDSTERLGEIEARTLKRLASTTESSGETVDFFARQFTSLRNGDRAAVQQLLTEDFCKF